ncbi:hypothetical protein PIB30_101805 [Stylosanthes scabra]|uniref:Uncharacterized protein n=1 Tax=Stylosanthes scabra TaxID=79078 RepID=A0ABU6XWH7_9FABA|nr:hypothetical protein [Stylosanthes scabra]
MDCSFEASGFSEASLLAPRAQEALRDYDPIESVRWAEWAMLRAATIMKSVEPRLTIADEAERQNSKLVGDLKAERLRELVAEEKVRANLAEVSIAELENQFERLAEDVKNAVFTTEGALKAQLAILPPDFDADQIGFFKDIVDGKVVDPSG